MKTIGYVLGDFPVFSETFVGDEIRAVRRVGHTVFPIVMKLRTEAAQIDDVALAREAAVLTDVSATKALRTVFRSSSGIHQALAFVTAQTRLPPRSLLWNALKISVLARSRGCNHLHAHFAGGAAAHAIVAARIAGLSVSFVGHGHDVYAEAEDLELKLRAADFVVAVCDDMANDLRRIAPDARVRVIACGVDEKRFAQQVNSRGNGRLLFVGRLVEQKGLDDLLSAIAVVPRARLDVVGDGPLATRYKADAAHLGVADRVNFLGPKPKEWIRENAPAYIGLVAPFKIAPDGSRDTGPLVIKEAMAMGIPVVSTRFMGVKETVTQETGFLSDPVDPEGLAQSIARLLEMNDEQRLAMGARGRARVASLFTQQRQAELLSNAFQGM